MTEGLKIRVLVVEDEPAQVRLVREMLEESRETSFQFGEARTLTEALTSLRGSGTDVVLLDLGLPDSQGLETCLRVHNEAPDVPVVVLSEVDSPDLAVEVRGRFGHEYLCKRHTDSPVLALALRLAVEQSRTEKRLEAVLRGVPDQIYIVNNKFRILWANRAFLQAHGSDALTKTCHEATRGRRAPCAPQPCHAVKTMEDGGIHSDENSLPDGRGERRWYHYSACAAGYASGRDSRAAVIVARDITDLKRTEESLRQSREQLFQSQKLEAVGRLAGGVAHDFNNLLTAIGAYTDFVLKSMDRSDPRRADLEEIRAAGIKASALTNQLLAFSRKQVLQPKVINLNIVLEGMEKLLRRTLPEEIALHKSLDPALEPIKADPSQMEQVILNLSVNARDAMPKGGKLILETANTRFTEAAEYEGFTIPAGKYALLAVSDTGSGMSPETRSHIFEPFFTTKERGKGTGLGLATVYGIVKQSGGFVSLYSEEGHGTSFKIYFPSVDEAVEEPARTASSLEELKGTETILLVEDDVSVRRTSLRILKNCGYRVLVAAEGAEGLALAERFPDRIHLLLTDVIMPKLDGRELASRTLGSRPEMRVLYMSGYTDEVIAARGVLEVGTHFLAKPFLPHELASKVRRILDED